jgi:DNA-directed RNA polymerase subunit alpha
MTVVLDQIEASAVNRDWDAVRQALASATDETLPRANRYVYTAMLAEQEHQWERAAEAYGAALEIDPDIDQATFRLGMLADRMGHDGRAIELYEQCSCEAPAPVHALINLSILYEDHERYEEALDCLNRVLEEYPNHARARMFRKDVQACLDMYYDEDRERFREKRNAILETPISDFELSVRSRNCLKQMDIHTLGDLLRTTAAELLSYKNFGETSLHEIETMLSQKGLRLGQLLEGADEGLRTDAGSAGHHAGLTGMAHRSVAELELSVRSRKCLMRLGVNTIGELLSRSEPELLAIKNFGQTSLSEIKRRLNDMGLTLKGG